MKEKIIRLLNFLFPAGNWRYYIMYLSSWIVLGVSAAVILVMMNIMIYGFTIATDTFVAQMPFGFPPRSDFAMSIVKNLSDLFFYGWLLFGIYNGLSLIADFIVRPVIWLIKTVKVIVFGYD